MTTELELSGQGLTSIPADVGKRTELRSLDLYDNRLAALPDSIWELTSLEKLNLAGNQFESISERVGELTRLRMLDLGHNKLKALPESLRKLQDRIRVHRPGDAAFRRGSTVGEAQDPKQWLHCEALYKYGKNYNAKRQVEYAISVGEGVVEAECQC